MHTITETGFSDYRVKGSRFSGYLMPSENADDVEFYLTQIKLEHPSATHHCYAWRLNPSKPEEYSTDDGEPGGSAGMPILNTIRSKNLINVLLAVIRYYGGTKLGKAGLIEAYGTSARHCIEHSNLKEVIPIHRFRIVHDYSEQALIDKLKNDFPLIEIHATYLEQVELVIGIPSDQQIQFRTTLSQVKHRLSETEEMNESFHVKS